jgi:DNA-binding GntR family transcriptional regulator
VSFVDGRPNLNSILFDSANINRDLLVDKIYNLLEEKIITGRLPPHYRLVEHEIANTLKVSRSPVREALLQLENNGLIFRGQTGRRIVHKYNKRDIIELYELWEMIEGFAVSISSEHSNRENRRSLKDVLNRMEMSLSKFEEYRELNQEYHQLLIHCCPNQKLKELHTKVLKQIHWFMNLTISHHPAPEISYRSHLRIYELFVKKRRKGLEEKVREHVRTAGERLRKEIGINQDGDIVFG